MTQSILRRDCVTGGTGFLGSHIISQLLASSEYIVRGTARSGKKLGDIFPNESRLEVVEVPDLTSDHTDALKGVQAVMHVAAPISNKAESGEELFNGIYEGTLHIIKQAINLGIKKIVCTGLGQAINFTTQILAQYANAFGPEALNEKGYGVVNKESVDYEKRYKAIWEIAYQHPDVDATIILPPAIYGPMVSNYPVTSRSSLGTNDWVYYLVAEGTYPSAPAGDIIDVRDAARAHIVALSVGPIPGKNKRFIVAREKCYWKEVAELIKKERPELAHRLPKEDLEPPVQTTAPLDLTFTEQGLGFTEYHYRREETLLAALDCGLALGRK
ncbi:hypothetical protein D9758_006374 [Tetrapyrgos nigripes]|uniref:3-beta hydroxysteroid dehydrogenase/isomerase domain-containing protein n=1 Tax=Tetrapyrgos nigripes TaxID=182062 RepID=A0A8H5DA79_9AGAR|nr:hypothetical protein D9758_006374 [Tetrapyrgos nigripes]